MDLSSSKETLIQMIYDLQKEIDKLKYDADNRITEIEKLLESQIENMKIPEKISLSTQTEKCYRETEECYTEKDFDIAKYENVWYMNGNAGDIIKWELRIKMDLYNLE